MPAPDLPTEQPARRTRSGRLKMLLVLLVCAAPVIASYFTYFVIRPEGAHQLRRADPADAQPAGAAAAHARRPRGRRRSRCAASGCWWWWARRLRRRLREAAVHAAPAARDARPRARPPRQGLAGHRRRPRCAAPLRAAARGRPGDAGAARRRAALARWLAPADGPALEQHLYVVDPMGEWMMRMPADPDPAASSATSSGCCAPRPSLGPAGPLSRWTPRRWSTSRPALRLLLLARVHRAAAAGLGVAAPARRRCARPAARADRADAVPHLRPDRLRRLHAAHRLRPGLPRLAGLLRQGQPARRARRDPRRADGACRAAR